MKQTKRVLLCFLSLLISVLFSFSACSTDEPAAMSEHASRHKETVPAQSREQIIGEATIRILQIENEWFFGEDYNIPGVFWKCEYHIGYSFRVRDVVSITYTKEEPSSLPADHPYYEKCSRYTVVTAETVTAALIVGDVTVEMDIPS